MKDLGYLRYFLSIKVASSPRGYLLSQSKYVADILEWIRLIDNKTVDTPIEVNTRYSSSNGLPSKLSISLHYSSRYCICCLCC